MNIEVDPASSEQSNNALSKLLIMLLKGVVYRESDTFYWEQLLHLQVHIRDHIGLLNLELTFDESEGYAFLRNVTEMNELPRLVAKRPLSYPVSLLLALLRKKLVEFDAGGSDKRLILNRDEIVEMITVFLPDTTNAAKLVDQVERHINKVVDLGFLQPLKSLESKTQPKTYEVKRIIKAFIDAQWLTEFNNKLEQYKNINNSQEEN